MTAGIVTVFINRVQTELGMGRELAKPNSLNMFQSYNPNKGNQ